MQDGLVDYTKERANTPPFKQRIIQTKLNCWSTDNWDYAARPAITCLKPSFHMQNCRQHVHCTVTLTDKNAADTFEITVANLFIYRGSACW